jgi:hypothetical protein
MVGSLGLLACIAFCEYLPVSTGSPEPNISLLCDLALLFDLALVGLVLGGCALSVALAIVRRQPSMLIWILPFLGILATALYVPVLVRHVAFAGLAERSKGLITAIESFKDRHGRYPANPLELPNGNMTLLSTGIRGYPEMEYTLHRDFWQLSVPCSRGMLNFDRFEYRSDGDYSQMLYEGVFDRIDGWAYLWE